MRSVEVELLIALIVRRDDLDDERGGRIPDAVGELAMQPQVGDAVVLLGPADVELASRHESRCARERIQEHRELRLEHAVPSTGCRVHMEYPFPNLIEQILTQLAAPLDQARDFHGLRVEH